MEPIWPILAMLATLVLAGCSTPPETATAGPPARLSAASATYQNATAVVHFTSRAAQVWTTNATQVPGRIVSTGRNGIPAIAVDGCLQESWFWDARDPSYARPRFRANGMLAPLPSADEVFWMLQPADLPARGNLDVDRAGLALRLERHGAEVQITWANPAEENQTIRAIWDPADVFPQRWGDLSRTAWKNEGEPVPCERQRWDRFEWGPWGPEKDFPLGHSFAGMMAQALADPTLFRFQQTRQDHPDAFIWQAIGIPDLQGSLLFPPPPFTDYHWQVAIGYPGATSGFGFTCDVREGAPEEPDLFHCVDGITWTTTEALADPGFGTWTASSFMPFFEFTGAFGGREPSVVFDTSGIQPMMLFSGLFEDGYPWLVWDAERGRIIDASGVGLDEFLESQ